MIRHALNTALLATLPLASMAHEGHSAESVHWHATDTWGFIVTLALVGVALWFQRKK